MKELLKELEEKLVEIDKEYLKAYNKLNDKTISLMEEIEETIKLNYFGGQKVALNFVCMRIKNKLEEK